MNNVMTTNNNFKFIMNSPGINWVEAALGIGKNRRKVRIRSISNITKMEHFRNVSNFHTWFMFLGLSKYVNNA